MKQIIQTAEVAFNAIDLQDAIVMLPVVDEVVRQYNNEIEWLAKNREEESRWKEDHLKKLSQYGNQLRVLTKLGFCPSDPAMIQECELFKL